MIRIRDQALEGCPRTLIGPPVRQGENEMRHKALGVVVALLLMVGLPLAGSEPASAAVTCKQYLGEIHKQSSLFGLTLYRFRNTMRLCVEQNSSYSTITSGQSCHSISSVDAAWSWQGLAVSNQQNGYYLSLWTTHRSNKTGHFESCWWIFCNNL